MNQLSAETSPYLLQHAANPVHWLPWREDAFERARTEGKPVLVSIGYSSCHWCHVMEHESFEDPETAALMNELFINIKVDREELPDVDHMYMDAVQAMTGSGGWPLNVFVTPDKKPFYGGTYFPPLRAHGRASWKEVLINVSQYFTQNRSDVDAQAEKLMSHLMSSSKAHFISEVPELQVLSNKDDLSSIQQTCRNIKQRLMEQADTKEGGFGVAPKFPSTFSIRFLLEHYQLFHDEEALAQACLSLDKMMMGGIHDHLGGGFSRYSTDTYWIAPHFEKMLYDNALLLEVYAMAYSITKNENYKEVAHGIVSWLKREMCSEEFGFYSAQDADSEGIEGKFFTWNSQELKSILEDDFEDFSAYYNIQEHGNWEHINILYTSYATIQSAAPGFISKLPVIRQKLFEVRSQRVKPMTDDKMLLGWNALMNKALLTAYAYIGELSYLQLAEENMHFMLTKFSNEKTFYLHTYKNGHAKIPAYLDDLAFLVDNLLLMATLKADVNYADKAYAILLHLEHHFLDKPTPFFAFAHKDFTQVQVNKIEVYDGAIPSPNAILCKAMFQLAYLYEKQDWLSLSENMLKQLFESMTKFPGSFGIWCSTWQAKYYQPQEVVIVGEEAHHFIGLLYTKSLLPNVMMMATQQESDLSCFKGKYQQGETLIYICKDFVCQKPLRDVNEAFTEISNTKF